MSTPAENTFPSRIHRTPGSSSVGLTIFILFRVLDPIFQYSILTNQVPLSFLPDRFGGYLLTLPTSTSVLKFPPYQFLILGMSVGNAVKQIYWSLFISQQELPVNHAVKIAVFNTTICTLNTFLSLWSTTTAYTGAPILQTPSIVIGLLLFCTGILTETVSEIQRKRFKQDSANAGKPYSRGLFGWARNINYTGYLFSRTGCALAAAGPVWGLITGTFLLYHFTTKSIPELDDYCQKRYGEAWTKVRENVPCVLLPGVY